MGADRAIGTLGRQGGPHPSQDSERGGGPSSHASPPARSASGGLERDPGLRPSMVLYHAISAAAAIIMAIPTALTSTCMNTASEISLKTKWPANERKMPRQKISREC